MDRRDFCLAATASVLTPGAALAAAANAAPGADFSRLDARLAERVSRGYFDGMSLIIGRGERVLHRASFGNGDADAVLHVASTGKWTATSTIAALVDEGKLAWDDPVAKFLPEFSGDKGAATLRQLLSHTAGYPDYQPEGRRRDDYQTLAESVARIAELPAADAPGAVFRYGGLAMQVAGRMAEIVAGMRFDEIFQSRLARPLGMTRSGYAPVSVEPGFNPMLGGGLFTCAADYARFLMMFSQNGVYRGKRILGAESVRAIESDQVGGARLKRGEYVESARQDLRRDIYGLGIWREEIGDDGRPSLLSSPGWAGAYSWVDRKMGLWGVVIAKANVERAVADGYSTFLGSSIYAPMARDAMAELERHDVARVSVPVRQGSLYCEQSGKGEVVILLHAHGLDRRQWEPQVAALQGRYRVIRYDLRGYGRSTMPEQRLAASHADDLLALMDGLGVRRAHLIGHALGGRVVADFIALHPERAISALVAGGDPPDAPGPGQAGLDDGAAPTKEDVAGYKRRWLERLLEGADGAPRLRMSLWRMIDEWPAWRAPYAEPGRPAGLAAPAPASAPVPAPASAPVPAPAPVPARSRGAGPATPVLLVRGDREPAASAIGGLPPQARRLVIPDCGHVANLEQPARFNAALSAWLAAR